MRRRSRVLLSVAAASLLALVLFPAASPASVEEQRRRLPPPATCKDPVEGLWLGLHYMEVLREWYHVELEIHREAPGSDRLKGMMTVHFWDGIPTDEKPPPCRPGVRDWTILQPSVGSYKDGKVRFDATSWQKSPVTCPQASSAFAYNLDHYSGTIDPAIQEFQSVNNDGGAAINDPTVFRRIKCWDSDPATAPPPAVTMKPPDFSPPLKRGASCFKSGPN